MAVKDESLYHATQNLILAKPRRYYHDIIDTNHWQLRSLISSPTQNTLYYPHGREIICLNTKTRVREVLSNVSFYPRCLTASKDWVCCGGEDGNYVAIALWEPSTETQSADVDPDARLPLDLDPTRRSSVRGSSSHARRSRSRPITPNCSTVGSEIVNCITLWSPGEERADRSYDRPVAVVSNNDRTISFLDLRDSELIEKLTLPDFVNRSVISPDGSLLASICDDPFLYIHHRRPKAKAKQGRTHSRPKHEYEWVLFKRYQLQGQRPDTDNLRGSFAACFSNSGKYLAVATQYGVISVFETVTLMMENTSIPVTFTTSRPGPETGAVRAMEFSPGPYDLLAWTEASGRFCVADVRNMFLSRQLVMLDSEADDVEKVVVLDRPAGHDSMVIDPRLRTSRHESRSSSHTPDFLAIEAERRQIRQLTRVILDRYDPPPFSTGETEVLHASQIARQQRDDAATRDASGEASGSLSWLTGNGIPRSSSTSTVANNELSTRDDRRTITGLPPALREFATLDRTTPSLRTFINERNRENDRRNLRQQEPRRRGSMMLAAAENALEREVARNEIDAAPSFERLTLTQPRVIGSDSPNNPWADIDALYRSRFPGEPPLDRSARLRVEMEDEQRRDFAHRLRQPWRPLSTEGLTTITPVRREAILPLPGVGHPGETMGCCWSPDGRVLYIGAGEGIYEYHVNVEGRKIFPSLVLR